METVPEDEGDRYANDQRKQDRHLDALFGPAELFLRGSELRCNQEQAADAGNERNDQKRFDDERTLLDRDSNRVEQLRDDEEDEPVVEEVGYNGDGLGIVLDVDYQPVDSAPQREHPRHHEQDRHDDIDAIFNLVDGACHQTVRTATRA